MKNLLSIIFLILVAACNQTIVPLPPITELDSYLQSSESQFSDITKGAEKLIVWANGKPEKTDYSVVYIHGYSATRQESAPITDLLGKALGANVFHTRLTGHGRPDDKMADSSIKAWKHDAWEAYNIGKVIGDKVIVVSVSTGGTLSTWLAAQEGTDALAVQIMLSPNFDIPVQSAYQLDLPLGLGVKYAEWTVGKTYSWEARNELQEKYWNTTYPVKAIRPMIRLLKEVKKIDKSKINKPTLIIYSPNDSVVLPAATKMNFAALGSTTKSLVVYLDSEDLSQHVLAGYILSPSTIQPVLNIMLDFLYKNKLVPQPVVDDAQANSISVTDSEEVNASELAAPVQ